LHFLCFDSEKSSFFLRRRIISFSLLIQSGNHILLPLLAAIIGNNVMVGSNDGTAFRFCNKIIKLAIACVASYLHCML
jgi:hypothetical protein